MHKMLMMFSFLMIFLVVMACKHVKVISNRIMNKLILTRSNNIDDTGENLIQVDSKLPLSPSPNHS